MAAAKLLLLGALVLIGCGSAPNPNNTNPYEKIVARSSDSKMCSIILRRNGNPDVLKEKRLSQTFDLIDYIRESDVGLAATYIDFQSLNALTITSERECNAAFDQWRARARDAGIPLGLHISNPFSPKVMKLSDAAVTPTISKALHQINGSNVTIEECSVVISLSPSASAEADHAIEVAIAKARDVYAVPILFSAQERSSLYVTFYRDCGRKEPLFDALRIVLKRSGEGHRVRSFADVSSGALRDAYGPVY